MRWRGIAAFLLAALVGAGSLIAVEPTGSEALDAVWLKGMKAGDVNTIAGCYAGDAVLWLPGGPAARGEKAIRDAYAGLLDANTVSAVALTDTHYETWQSLAVGWGHFSMTLQPKAGGAPVTMTGRFTSVSKKVDGKWKYVADHASDDPPPAPKPTATK